MQNFFVSDLWQWRSFFTEKEYFYSSKERTLHWSIVLFFLFALTYLFTSKFIPHERSLWFLLFNVFLIILVITIHFLYRDLLFTYRFLPFVFYALLNFILILLNTELIVNDFASSFQFLLSDELVDKIANNSANASQLDIARVIIISFLSSVCRFGFVLFFAVINFVPIKNNLYSLFNRQTLIVLFFFLFVFLINILIFKPALGSLGNSWFVFLNQNSENTTSANQSFINQIATNSSTFHFIYYYLIIILLTPFWEELIFRYSVFAIFGKSRVGWAIIFAIFFFTVVHYQKEDFVNLETGFIPFLKTIFSSNLALYLYGSILLTSIFWFYDLNLFFPIFFHFMWNFNASLTFLTFV